jgi:hypothetical protein
MRNNILVFKTAIWTILLLFSLNIPQQALADIAPPEQPSGGNPVPGQDTTQVRMVDERVLIELIPTTSSGSLGKAKVTAQFSMQNQGNETERLAVRFPMTNYSGSDPGSKLIQNIKVMVDGSTVQIRQVNSALDDAYTGPWAEFMVNFDPGKDVNIAVEYYVEGEGEYPFIALRYIFDTGSGWKDTIGSADLTVRLPYEVNDLNVIFDTEIGWSTTVPGGVIEGRDIRWHFDNFEPTSMDNFSISLVMPSVWRALLREKENITESPRDGEAWGRLGKLYKDIFFLRKGFREDAGGQKLYMLSQEAYQNAISLLPEDALWQAGFAELLWGHWYYSQRFRDQSDYSELI